jgi:hypothetical protein
MEQMTIRQVLEITIDILGAISVPMSMKEQIADPIGGAMSNLQMCLNAMTEAEENGRKADTE